MKRTKFAAALAVLTLLTTLTGCGQAKEADGALEPVTLNEVAHSIFYVPQYAAIELGYFKDEGIALTLVNGAGADKVMTSLISGDADIGFMGSEASIYVYQEGSADYAVNFAQLTQRAGNFLVGRSAEPDFSWQDLKGKKVLGGRAGGMPEMVFEYILKKNGIDPKNDLTIDQSINFGLTAAALRVMMRITRSSSSPSPPPLKPKEMVPLSPRSASIPVMSPTPPTVQSRAI